MTGGDTLEQLIGSALVDGQIVRLIEEENETTIAIVTRISGGSMIVHPSEEKKGGRVWLRVLSASANKPAMWPGRPERTSREGICANQFKSSRPDFGNNTSSPDFGGELFLFGAKVLRLVRTHSGKSKQPAELSSAERQVAITIC
jgi:hypothetical protein